MLEAIRRFVRDESGMEMVEWAIVATVFAVAAAFFWQDLAGAINDALDTVEETIRSGAAGGGGSG